MTRKKKRLLIFAVLLLVSAVVLALGLKYFPFTRMVKLPADAEQEFVNPAKKTVLAPHTLYYDFEVPPGKPVPDGFYKGVAHSGHYSVKAFGQNSFSVVIERTVKEIGAENLKAVALSAWIYVFPTKTDVKGRLVFTASNEVGVNVCWQGLSLVEPEVPKGKWFKISGYFDLAQVQFKPDYKLQFYFWNNTGTDILIDDYFISFGGVPDRRGDSARVDLTRPEGFVAKFNYPPFPVSFLEKEALDGSVNPADIDQEDILLTGDFLGTGTDALLAVKKSGKLSLYPSCPGTREFRKTSFANPSLLAPVLPVKKVLKGKFLSKQADQLLLVGEKGWILAEISMAGNPCSGSGTLQATLKTVSSSEAMPGSVFSGDFNGDQRSELLLIADNGSWKLLRYKQDEKPGSQWKIMAGGESAPLPGWDRNARDIGISVGRFHPGTSNDVVLAVTRNKTDGKPSWFLRKFNGNTASWDELTGKTGNGGMTIGLDTLKPEDRFYALPGHGNRAAVFRYNREWRYDLKEIRFNDSTFAILSGVDFHGYEKDFNPKYYESLKLVPGSFFNQPAGSFLVFGHVAASRNYQATLPDFVHLYALPVAK